MPGDSPLLTENKATVHPVYASLLWLCLSSEHWPTGRGNTCQMASPPLFLGEGDGVGVYISAWAVLCHSTDMVMATSSLLTGAASLLSSCESRPPAVLAH